MEIGAIGDTITKHTYSNYYYIVADDYERIVYSTDSLEVYTITKIGDQTDLSYSLKRYNPNRQIVFEADSTKESCDEKFTLYDSTRRLKQIQWKDPDLRYLIEYEYGAFETNIAEYSIYSHLEHKSLSELHTICYDQQGNLLYEDIKTFGKGETSSSVMRETVGKYYEDNKLERVIMRKGGLEYLYILKYE